MSTISNVLSGFLSHHLLFDNFSQLATIVNVEGIHTLILFANSLIFDVASRERDFYNVVSDSKPNIIQHKPFLFEKMFLFVLPVLKTQNFSGG